MHSFYLNGGMLAWLCLCRFAYGPAIATATHYLLLQKNQISSSWFYLSGAGSPG